MSEVTHRKDEVIVNFENSFSRTIVGAELVIGVCTSVCQSRRCRKEKKEFFTLFGKVVSEIDDGDKLLIYGDMNGHVRTEVDGFEGVHGG